MLQSGTSDRFMFCYHLATVLQKALSPVRIVKNIGSGAIRGSCLASILGFLEGIIMNFLLLTKLIRPTDKSNRPKPDLVIQFCQI